MTIVGLNTINGVMTPTYVHTISRFCGHYCIYYCVLEVEA